MDIGNTLKELRKEQNLTQFELANELNIGQATIAGYENNTREPRINSLIAYANFFQCSLDFLVGREDDFGNILTPQTNPKNPPTLSKDEKELLALFNPLKKEYKDQILQYARFIHEQATFQKKNKF